MPLTPFHLGPGLFLGTLFWKFISLPAILLGSVILDLECLYNIILGITPWHGFFHTLAGAAVAAVILVVILFLLRKQIGQVMKVFRLEQKQRLSGIFLGSFLGIYLQLLFDYFTHSWLEPVPGYGNPLYLGTSGTIVIYVICVITGVIGLVLLIRRMMGK